MNYTFITFILIFMQIINVHSDLTITFKGETLATVNRSDFTSPVFQGILVDEEKLETFIDKIEEQVTKEPVDATIDPYGRLVPEQYGYSLDRKRFSEAFYAYFFNNSSDEIEVPRFITYPRVDSELLLSLRNKQVGQYVTYFNKFNKQRAHNISLAVDAINNYVVFPGETFSFNQVVGNRTVEKGYLPAPIIVRGELTDGIGGGICQVSSTLFNAVDKVGVEIVQRYSHSRRVRYVPPGRDATVSWYGPDFKFKNNYTQPLLIQARLYGGSVIIRIFSSETFVKPQKKTS
ncbi:VanW family protein [Alkalihalobacterium chitinilyticum]|uniref:VanW family protein n=1 Tax=Alkalihalobacterium chitinilyticum TaxID=2980103 RepID=A0ABT5VG65_9BACI|nr:VanW family protein [Alkalihalobacterium chitinilyticum]MDE5414446.1 VanW family protein [Alkalihalobacterium chitinilyticum]